MTSVWPPRKLEDFDQLTKAEQTLHDEVGRGLPVVIGESVPPVDAPEELKIRASFIRYLALGGSGKCRPHERGLVVRGAYVLGDRPDELDGPDKADGADTKGLDLGGCDLKFDLGLENCRFPDAVLMRDASLGGLYLSGSHLERGLLADRMVVTGDVQLNSVTAKAVVSLIGVKSRGLECSGANFEASRESDGKLGIAFSAESLEATGNVFFDRVRATGEVRFSRRDDWAELLLRQH